jgi:plasmid rolling circle replication initiator protein Rep
LESKRLRLLHKCRLQTIEQLKQLGGRAVQLRPESFELDCVRRAVTSLLTCSAHLIFEVNAENDFARLKSGRFCRCDRLCACCARLRAARLVRDYGRKASSIFRRGGGRFKPVHVVLTVRNGEDLGGRFEMLRSSWAKLLQQRRNHAKGHRVITSVFSESLGGVGSVEIKRGSGSGLWHPHLHAVLIVRSSDVAADLQQQLKQEWEAATGGDSFNVHVGEVHAIERGQVPTADAMRGAFAEVFKYATKGSQMTPADSYEAWMLLRGRKLIQSFGRLFGVREPAVLGDVREDVEFELSERVYVETPGGYVLQVGAE